MKSPFIVSLLALCASACSEGEHGGAAPDAGTEPEAPDAGSEPGPEVPVDADPPGACHPSVLNSAPVECQSDWSHAQLEYPSRCAVQNDGYQAACDPYDAIVYEKLNSTVRCLYERSTGNLIAAVVERRDERTCQTFDLHFEEPDLSACAPAATGTACDDGGP